MRGWWRDHDPLPGVDEQALGGELSVPEVVLRLLADREWTATAIAR